MSSAELQSLMSQLQAQRQDPYSESNLHAEHFDKRFTYVDGSPGDDGKPENPDNNISRISRWEDNTYMDKKKDKKFAFFPEAKAGNYPGSIDYSEVERTPGAMALTIAWEAWHRQKAERKLAKMEKKLEQMKNTNTAQSLLGMSVK